MLPLTETQIRGSFVNASRKEVGDIAMPVPAGVRWDRLDFLGWRDPKQPRRAYAVIPTLDAEPVGVLFKQTEASPRTRAQCSWCQDVKLPNDVVFFGARRVGRAGRNGGSVGVLVCEAFQCSHNVRQRPALAYEGFDVEAARQRRIDALRLRVAGFAEDLLDGSAG